jgi:hypothetical protein
VVDRKSTDWRKPDDSAAGLVFKQQVDQTVTSGDYIADAAQALDKYVLPSPDRSATE